MKPPDGWIFENKLRHRVCESECPFCGCPDPYYRSVEIDGDEARQEVHCYECEEV